MRSRHAMVCFSFEWVRTVSRVRVRHVKYLTKKFDFKIQWDFKKSNTQCTLSCKLTIVFANTRFLMFILVGVPIN